MTSLNHQSIKEESLSSKSSSGHMDEYDEVLNNYHQKKKAQTNKKRLQELLTLSMKRLKEYHILDFIRLLDETMVVLIGLHTIHSAVARG